MEQLGFTRGGTKDCGGVTGLRAKILLLDNWCAEAIKMLDAFAEVYVDAVSTPYSEIDGVIWPLGEKLTVSTIEDNCPNLKFVASCTTSLDHIDTDYCRRRGIEVISLQGETEFLHGVHATAEHTMALILALVRKLPFAHNDVCAGNWDRERWQGAELHGKKLGIVGYGRVGRQVADYAEAFGMFPIACDKGGNLEFVLRNADIITVHVPLTEETRSMFGYEQFKTMKPTAYFINASRGAVVDEAALLWALDSAHIAGAALDVVCGEPNNINPALLEYARTHTNLILTPHIGGNTWESREKTQVFIAQKIREFIVGGG